MMQEITDNIIGYNDKTKHMEGLLIPIDYNTDMVGVIPYSIYWEVEDVHEFIENHKSELLEYTDGFVFLPLKKNKTFEDIVYINGDFFWNDYYGDGELVFLDHYDFNMTLSKELADYAEEQMCKLDEMYL